MADEESLEDLLKDALTVFWRRWQPTWRLFQAWLKHPLIDTRDRD